MIKLSHPKFSKEAIHDLKKVLDSGQLVQGEWVTKLESELESYLGVKNAIVVSSCTAALHLAVLSLGISNGDQVIVPSFTWPSPANMVEISGADSVMVDINSDDFCINVDKIEESITKKTKAIIVVHEFGQSADIEKIMTLAQTNNLKVIEDSACAVGTEFKGKKVGTFGDIGCFSFHPRKIVTTGEGGALVTNDDELAKKLRSYRNHGIVQEYGKMDFHYPGLNYRLTEFQAVLGVHQMRDLDDNISNRIMLANKYYDYLEDLPWLKLPDKIKGRKHVYQTFHAMLSRGKSREKLINYLKIKNIEANLGAQALPRLKYYKEKYSPKNHPVAIQSYECGLALPMGSHLDLNNIKYICDTIKSYNEL